MLNRSNPAFLPALFLLTQAAFLHPHPTRADEPKPKDKVASSTGALVDSLLSAHNRERAEAKLPPLSFEPKLNAAAKAHADDMASHRKMSHEGTDGSTPFDRIKRQKYHYKNAGENVAEGQPTVEAVMKAWMESPHHRENILGKFTKIGIGVSEDEDGHPYYCVDFATPWPKIEPERTAADLLTALNKERSSADLPALRASTKLAAAASSLASVYASQDALEPPQAPKPDVAGVLKESGYRFQKLVMLVGAGEVDGGELLKRWLKDPAQGANLLGDFSQVGIGYASAATGVPYCCVLLAVPAGD